MALGDPAFSSSNDELESDRATGGGITEDESLSVDQKESIGVIFSGEPVDGEFEPAVVTQVEYDVTGNVSTMTDQCGNTEARRNGDMNVTITVEGLVYKRGAVQFQNMRTSGDLVTVTSDLFTGELFNQDLRITHENDVNELQLDDGRRGQAYRFQAQFKSEEE